MQKMALCSQRHHFKNVRKDKKKKKSIGSREKLGSHKEGGEVWLSIGHGASKCTSCVPTPSSSRAETVAVLWDWGSIELGRLRCARVKPPARFTGVSPRMWAVCTAELRRCQRAPHRPLRAPARKRMAFLEGLRFFSPTPLWILLWWRTWMFIYSGVACLLFLILAQRALNYLTLWSVKYCRSQSRC